MATEAQVRATLERKLQPQIDTLAATDQPGVLFDLPSRMTQQVIDAFYSVLEGLVETGAVGAILRDPDVCTKIIHQIDDANNFKLSKAAYKGQRLDWARREADKLRVIWGYFERSVEGSRWSHSNALNMLGLKRQDKSPSPDALPMSGASNALDSLPEPPASEPEDAEDDEAEKSAPASHALVAAPASEAPANTPTPQIPSADVDVTDLTVDDDDKSTPTCLQHVAAHLSSEPVDHNAHKSLFKRPGRAPKTLAEEMKRPAAALKRPTAGEGEPAPKKRPASHEEHGADATDDGDQEDDVNDEDEEEESELDNDAQDDAVEQIATGATLLSDYALRTSSKFQTMLRAACGACGRSFGARPFKSSLVVTFQRDCYIFSVKDKVSKPAVAMISSKQAPNLAAAEMAGFCLLALYDGGADRDDLQAVKVSGAFGFKCGRAFKASDSE